MAGGWEEQVKVNFYATLRQIVGGKTVEVDVPDGITVKELLDKLATRYPDLRPELLDGDGNLHGYVHVFVNGRDVPFLANKINTRISPQDAVNIFPPVGGG
jgi:molybdopterin synthase sulfur carrier subunit